MQVTLRLRTTRCPDGVELGRRDELAGINVEGYGTTGPIWFCCRSERYHREVVREAIDLADPLVVRFINATDDTKRLAFISRFGFPRQLFPDSLMEPHNFILDEQRVLRRLLAQAGGGDAARATKAANESLVRAGGDGFSLQPDGRMVLTVTSPTAFMRMEIAMVAQNGARLTTCKRCGNVFLTGKLTKRRLTSQYCRDLCRVGAHRAKQKGD
jgi:hypothetical protein